MPSLEIEQQRAVVIHRMAGSDIDVESVTALAEAAQEVKIFEALRVGYGSVGHLAGPRCEPGMAWILPHQRGRLAPTPPSCAAKKAAGTPALHRFAMSGSYLSRS